MVNKTPFFIYFNPCQSLRKRRCIIELRSDYKMTCCINKSVISVNQNRGKTLREMFGELIFQWNNIFPNSIYKPIFIIHFHHCQSIFIKMKPDLIGWWNDYFTGFVYVAIFTIDSNGCQSIIKWPVKY